MTMVGMESKPASCLYMQLSRDHRVSRSFRATWFLKSLTHSVEPCTPPVDPSSVDISVLSAVEGNQLVPGTDVFYVCHRYSLVFVLDMSPTMMTASNTTYKVKVDEAVSSLHGCLRCLARPFQVPGSSVTLEPQLCVTVMAYCGSAANEPIHVLMQGVDIHCGNWESLTDLEKSIRDYEISLSQDDNAKSRPLHYSSYADYHSKGDNSLEGMVKAGALAMQLLPRNCLKGLILLTDGICGFSSPNLLHNTVNMIRGHNISCWAVQVGGPPDPTAAFGLLPDTETLHFITMACNGCIMTPEKIQQTVEGLCEDSLSVNAVQKAILLWTFEKGAHSERIREVMCEQCREGDDYFAPVVDHGFLKYTITAPLLCVTGCRIREGFLLRDVCIRETMLDVYLYYQWQPSVSIYYTITAPWPVTNESATLEVTISYDGPYFFVDDVNRDMNPSTDSQYRVTAARKFKQALKTYSNSDALLAHLLSFSATPTYHTLPQTLQDGMPLFYLQPNQTKPVPSIGLSTSGEKRLRESPLITFWRPLCTIDTNLWYRWFHSDKIVLILQQDSYLPRNLLAPSSNGRFASLQCRLAASRLFAFLKSWSSFILLENHSFIQFLPSKESPKYFCFIRVAQKHPCVVLHVGHIEGTPHTLQSESLQSLYCDLRKLGGSEKTTGHGTKRRSKVAQQAKPCATVIDKQLQRVMIRYDNLPGHLATQSLSLVGGGEGERQLQMDYLSCTHWQWRVPHCGPAIPSALLRHRLKEGFHLTSAHNGVVTLAVQLTMQQSNSQSKSLQMLLQYVIFPADENLKCVTTELWVEPQYGQVLEAPPGLQYLKGLHHSQISDKLQAEDEKLVAAMSSFLFLRHCCERRLPQLPLDEGEEAREMVGIDVRPAVKSCSSPFQLSSLLDKSRVLGFTMTTFSEVNTAATLNLSSCSPLNRTFREQFLQQLRGIAPTEVSVTDFQPLLCRLLASESLAELCRVSYLREDATRRGWKCFAQSQQDSLFMFLVPAYFSLHPDTREREDDSDSPQAFSLPVVLLCCHQQILMDPDPAQPAPPILQPDVYQHLSLSPPQQQATSSGGSFPEDGLAQLVSKLRVIHFSSYLHTMHSTLLSRSQLTQEDFLSALTVCRQTSLSVDLTPLIAALCPHASTHLPATIGEVYQKSVPMNTEVLCHLLEALLSRRQSNCQVCHAPREPSSAPHCTLWKSEVDQAFSGYLAELGFVGVPECGGYYWLNTGHEREHPKSAPSPELFPDFDLPNSDHDDEEGVPGSPGSEPSTIHKLSFTEDYEGNTDISTEIPDRASQTPSSEGDLALSPLLSALSLPDKLGTPGRPQEDSQWTVAPLFLKIVCTVTNHETRESNSAAVILPSPGLPVCLKSVLSDTFQAESYSVSLDLIFYSFSPETQPQPAVQDVRDNESVLPLGEVAPPGLPAVYHSTALGLKRKTEWLIRDELISVSRDATPITAPLLQAVATHVQTSKSENCLIQHVPLKFVFGVSHSMSHFILLLESIEGPTLSIVKVQDYYYLTPRLCPSRSQEDTPDLEEQELRVELRRRNSVSPNLEDHTLTPSHLSYIPKSRTHRRSASLGFVRGHTPTSHTPTPPPQLSSYDSVSSVEYDASRSGSLSSLSGRLAASLDSDHQEEASQLWLVLRVLEHQVEVYFQTRSSHEEVGSQLKRFRPLCDQVVKEIRQTCHKTNQWYLLKDMLDTRLCSPLLLPESAPDAWVDKIQLPGERESGQGGEGFLPQEFMCGIQWRKHITPHWRLKAMKTQAALRITRTALDAFAVINRVDVYVLQDVKETGEETIFYLKIDESLCRVEDNISELEESLAGEGLDRCETKTAIDATESLSSYSFSIQQSTEVTDPDFRGSSMEIPSYQPGRPQESLVLQLYGIAKPSTSLIERLSFIISMKLDDAALEMMCGLYARNQKLRLNPVDVHFLQPLPNEASHILSLPIPSWIRVPEVEAFTFYFLQALSAMALRPKYTSSDTRDQFSVAQPLHNAYTATGLPQGLHQDHLFLYIRPHTQGRGMAVICASLVNPHGRTMAPQPGVVSPATGSCPLDLQREEAIEEAMQCQIQELSEPHPPTGSYSFHLHIWEKGNAGMTDLSAKLTSCFKHAMSDYLLELCLLPLPIARQPEGSFVWDSATNSPNAFLENEGPGNKVEKRGAYEAGSRRASSEKGEVHKAGSRRTSNEQPPARSPSTRSVESSSLKSDAPVRSRRDTEKIVEDITDALLSENGGSQGEGSSESSLTWHGKEWLRREQEARDRYYQEAHFGRSGVLDETYHTTIQQHLAHACKLASPSVTHCTYTFMGSHSARTFLTEAIASIQQLCPDLNISTFEKSLPGEVAAGQYAHCIPERDWSRVERVVELSDLHYMVIGRNLRQWEECCDPTDLTHRSTHPWVDPHTKQSLQLFYPLDSKKFVRGVEVPLQQSVVGGEAFVPRQRLVLMSVTSWQAQLWLYNLSEELMSRVRHQLNVLGEWQQMRVGLLHHILAQKMGLFQHTHARDIQNCTKTASKHCSSIQVVSNVVKSASPIANEPMPIRSPHRPHVIGTVAIETFYQETPPHTCTPRSADPVYNHGQQLRDSHAYQRRQYESQELLGKVFTSWQSRKGGESAPVNSATIDNLKRRARLLHYCTSPLLLQQSLLSTADTQGQDKPPPWFDAIREGVLSLYIQYLQSLGFQTINERAPTVASRQKAGSRTPSRSTLPLPPPQLYKCLQRSWPGGIILTELLFRGDKFHVKLYTLESSRLVNQTTLSPEVHSLFSMECARHKDFIHVHSFMHDFHLRFLLSLLSGNRQPPENFDIRRLLQLFRHHNKVPPNFIRSRLCKDSMCVPVAVDPSDLYRYIVAHCGVFGMETFEMCPGASRSHSSHEDICLLIDVSPSSLGPTTTPQLSRLLNFQDSYSIRILTVYKQQPVEDRPRHLKLSFFLLLVNKFDFFPRLTCDSPHLSATHHTLTPTPTLGPLEQKRDESELNFNVRKHRRKLGFGSLTSPSGPSQVVLDVAVMEEQLRGLREHLQDVIKSAQCNMRRDELWKRLLYGKQRTDTKPSSVHFEPLSCAEFQELLRLVTVCHLDSLDARLSPLRKQTKKWYRKLMVPLAVKFADTIRFYSSEGESHKFAAIVNPEWQDMFVLVQSDRDGRHQGFSAVYRKPREGGVPLEERPITAHIEADRSHMETVVNFACSYLWASILDTSPPQPHLNLL